MTYDFPLLAPKALRDFTPEEFKQYIRGLNRPKKVARRTANKKPKRYSFAVRVSKLGKITITSKRTPRYLTEEEIKGIEKKINRPANEVYLAVRRCEFHIMTHAEADAVRQNGEDLPW